jgi:hypothetical protein
MQNETLATVWNDQVSRITPLAEQSEFNDLLQFITSKISDLLEKLFRLGTALHAPGISPRMFIIILVGLFVSITGFILWRRYSFFIKAAIRSFRFGDDLGQMRTRYQKLVSDGLYALALREYVRTVSDNSNQRGHTFAELFSISAKSPLQELQYQYGESIHLDHAIQRESLEQFEKDAGMLYPQFEKIVKRKGRP